MIEIPMSFFVEICKNLPDPKDCKDGELLAFPFMDENGKEIQIRFIKENDNEWAPLKDVVIKGYLNRIDKVKSLNPINKFFKELV